MMGSEGDRADGDRRPDSAFPDRTCALLLAAIVLLAVLVRIAAAIVLEQPLDSDSLAYFTMAQGLAERGELVDLFGQHSFYSAGYPLLLAPFFRLFGASVAVALAVNFGLAAIGTLLVHRLTTALSSDRRAGLLAALVYALWLPGIWNATSLAKENLSTPLLLGLALCAIAIARNRRPAVAAPIAGLLWGASLVTGGSALLLCAGVAVALLLLWRSRRRAAPVLSAGLGFAVGAALMVGPWLLATDHMVGRPVLSTNAAFNLYLGNNPAATGRFVSIADTPLGKDWEATRLRLGEIGNADRLQAEALRWIGENPGRAAGLAVRKLVYFWQPNIPDAADFASSKAVSLVRLCEVAQYGLILLFALFAFRAPQVPRDGKWVLAAMIAGFWLIHAAAYIITRYRDPVIPLLIALGAVPAAAWLRHATARRILSHAG